MVGETEIRKAFSLSLNGDTVETGCIYGCLLYTSDAADD